MDLHEVVIPAPLAFAVLVAMGVIRIWLFVQGFRLFAISSLLVMLLIFMAVHPPQTTLAMLMTGTAVGTGVYGIWRLRRRRS